MAKRISKKRQEEIIQKIIIGIIIIAIMIFALFRLGIVGMILNNMMRYILGDFYYFTVFSLIFMGLYFIGLNRKIKVSIKMVSGIILLNIVTMLISSFNLTKHVVGFAVLDDFLKINPNFFTENFINYGGGFLGSLFYALTSSLFDESGTIVLICALIFIGLILIIPFETLLNIYHNINDKHKLLKEKSLTKKELKAKSKRNEEVTKEKVNFITIEDSLKEEPSIIIDADQIKEESIFIDADKSNDDVEVTSLAIEPDRYTVDGSDHFDDYILPNINVFDSKYTSKSGKVNNASAELKGQKVIEILHNFGIEAQLIKTHIGPSVTKFEIKPDSSVKVSRIQNISDNIKMELAARDIRIEAPIPGRNAVGIEIPNVEPIPVRMYDLLKDIKTNNGKPLLFLLGKDLMGKVVTCELDKMPHLLIAGSTGSGKSVCINTIITSFLYFTNPEEVKLVLIDPKKVEFTPYHDIPHLLWPVITDSQMASNMLKKVVVMMEGRFDLFAEVGVRNIKSYNEQVDIFNANLKEGDNPMKKLPYMVVIIDELADLMMIAGKDVEASIQRITQLARASGIHLIVATQRPSTDVITGIIKSNIPSRISFAVASSIDSRTILDQTGAERLLGNGDMLYAPQGENSPIRLQGVFVTDKEVKNITNYCKKQAKPNYDDTYFEFLNVGNPNSLSSNSRSEKDSLYDEVKEYVIDVQKASTSLLQRRFGIGYNRAAGLIDALEENGVVGPINGSKPREVYIKKEVEEE